jgi:transposase InsO family protein
MPTGSLKEIDGTSAPSRDQTANQPKPLQMAIRQPPPSHNYDYNEVRPHRSLGNKSPKEFVLVRERDATG